MERPKPKKKCLGLSLDGTPNEIDSNLQRPNIDSNLMVGGSPSISNAQQHTNADHLKMDIVPYTGIGSVEVVWGSPSGTGLRSLHAVGNSTSSSISPKKVAIADAREGTETDEQEAAQTDPQKLQSTCNQHVMVMDWSPTESRKDKTSVDLSVRPSSCKRSLAGNNNFHATTRHENIPSFEDITSDRYGPINASPATTVSEGVDVGNLSYSEEDDDLTLGDLLRRSKELEAKFDAPKAGTCKVSDTKSTRSPLGVPSSFQEFKAVSNQSSSASYTRGTNSQVNKSSGDKICLENKGTTNVFGIANSVIQARDNQPMYYLGGFRKLVTATELGRNVKVTNVKVTKHTSHSSKGRVQGNPNSGTITNKLSSSVPKGDMTHVLPSHRPWCKHHAVNANVSHKGPSGVGSMSSEDHDATSDANPDHSEPIYLKIWDSWKPGMRGPFETSSDAVYLGNEAETTGSSEKKESLTTDEELSRLEPQGSSP